MAITFPIHCRLLLTTVKRDVGATNHREEPSFFLSKKIISRLCKLISAFSLFIPVWLWRFTEGTSSYFPQCSHVHKPQNSFSRIILRQKYLSRVGALSFSTPKHLSDKFLKFRRPEHVSTKEKLYSLLWTHCYHFKRSG